MENELLCVIPARIGSRRLPRKNIRELAGKPMIAYSIEGAIKSKLFEKVYVATDSQDIAQIAQGYGADIPYLLPSELAQDDVSSLEPCLHIADYLEQQGKKQKFLFCVQPTSPLRMVRDFRESWRIFQDKKLNFLVSVTPIDPHYFHWAMEEKQGWHMFFRKRFLKERIYLPEFYRPNGAIKIGKIAALRRAHSFFGRNLAVYHMPEERSVHVATEFDFKIAEMLIEERNR